MKLQLDLDLNFSRALAHFVMYATIGLKFLFKGLAYIVVSIIIATLPVTLIQGSFVRIMGGESPIFTLDFLLFGFLFLSMIIWTIALTTAGVTLVTKGYSGIPGYDRAHKWVKKNTQVKETEQYFSTMQFCSKCGERMIAGLEGRLCWGCIRIKHDTPTTDVDSADDTTGIETTMQLCIRCHKRVVDRELCEDCTCVTNDRPIIKVKSYMGVGHGILSVPSHEPSELHLIIEFNEALNKARELYYELKINTKSTFHVRGSFKKVDMRADLPLFQYSKEYFHNILKTLEYKFH